MDPPAAFTRLEAESFDGLLDRRIGVGTQDGYGDLWRRLSVPRVPRSVRFLLNYVRGVHEVSTLVA